MSTSQTKAFVITLLDNEESVRQADRLIFSSSFYKNDFEIEKFEATTPDNVVTEMKQFRLKWNYPWSQPVYDMQSGLYKSPYETADPNKRIACFLSHYRLWLKCVELDEPIFVFEHDALFTRRLEIE